MFCRCPVGSPMLSKLTVESGLGGLSSASDSICSGWAAFQAGSHGHGDQVLRHPHGLSEPSELLPSSISTESAPSNSSAAPSLLVSVPGLGPATVASVLSGGTPVVPAARLDNTGDLRRSGKSSLMIWMITDGGMNG